MVTGSCRIWTVKNKLWLNSGKIKRLWALGLPGLVIILILDRVAVLQTEPVWGLSLIHPRFRAVIVRTGGRTIQMPVVPFTTPRVVVVMVTYALITFHLDYWNVVYMGLSLKTIWHAAIGPECSDMGSCRRLPSIIQSCCCFYFVAVLF